jgi:hypothetical protein
MSALSRKLHRAVAVLFTLLVAANFAAMALGPVPPWLTYAPLLPLLLLMASGSVMFFQPCVARRRAARKPLPGAQP